MTTLLDEVRTAKALPSPARARRIREDAGITQERLARELKVHRMTVQRWETGERRPSGKHRLKYAALLEQIRQELGS